MGVESVSVKDSVYLLSSKPVEGCHHLPVITISYLPVGIDFSRFDALLFSSKNSVKAIEASQEWRKLPCYAVGKVTAEVLKEQGANLQYTSLAKSGNLFAQELIPRLSGKKVLYLRAGKIASRLPEILRESGINLEESIVYETVCRDESFKAPPKDATLLFASPSTVRCFLERFPWNPTWQAVAFGETTAGAFPDDISCKISSAQSLAEALKLL